MKLQVQRGATRTINKSSTPAVATPKALEYAGSRDQEIPGGESGVPDAGLEGSRIGGRDA